MKKTLILLAVPVALAMGQGVPSARKAKPSTQPSGTVPATLTVPEGAVRVDANTYTYTDAKGAKWIYRQTPFGLVKREDKPEVDTPSATQAIPTTVKDLGESVKFTRQTPFGSTSWTRRKADLTDEEKALVANAPAVKPQEKR